MAIYNECHNLCGRAFEGCSGALYSDTLAYSTVEFVILTYVASTNFAEMPGGFTSPVTGGK